VQLVCDRRIQGVIVTGAEAAIQDLADELYELKTAVKSLTDALSKQGAAAPPAPDWEWLDSEQLAFWLGLDVRALYKLRSSKQAPRAHRVGKTLRFRRRDVESWLRTRAEQ